MIKDYYSEAPYGVFSARLLHHIAAELPGDTPVIIVDDERMDTIERAASLEAVKAQPWAHEIAEIFNSGETLNFYTADRFSSDVLIEHDPGLGFAYEPEGHFTLSDIVAITQNDAGQNGDNKAVKIVDSASYAEQAAQDPESDDFEPCGNTQFLIYAYYVQNDSFSVFVLEGICITDKEA